MDLEQEIKIPTELEPVMLDYAKTRYGDMLTHNLKIKDFTCDYFNKEKATEILKYSVYAQERITPSMNILDAGTGAGLSVIGFRKLGFKAYGYEIDKEIWQISQKLLVENELTSDIIQYVAPDYQNLPYADSSFDLIFSHFVLEHVRKPIHYLSELKRILKNEGKIILVCPNYNILFETHYGLFIFPPKFGGLNKLMLKIRRRNQTLLSQLCFPTPAKLKKWITHVGLNGKNLSREYFIQSLFYERNYAVRSHQAVFLSRVCVKFKLLWAAKLLTRIGFYNPIFFILTHQD